MTVHFNSRNTTDAVTTAPMNRRTTGGRVSPRWTRPAAMAALVVVGLVGVYGLRNPSARNEPTTTTTPRVETTADVGPLIVAEEPTFTNRQQGRVPRAVSPAAVAETGVEPLVTPEEPAFVDGEYSLGRTVRDDWCRPHEPC